MILKTCYGRDIGAKIGWLIWAGLGLTVVGLLLGAGGIALILVFGRRATRAPSQPAPPPAASDG